MTNVQMLPPVPNNFIMCEVNFTINVQAETLDLTAISNSERNTSEQCHKERDSDCVRYSPNDLSVNQCRMLRKTYRHPCEIHSNTYFPHSQRAGR